MTTRETDTSGSEALFDALVEGDVLTEDEGGVRTTDAFDDTHAVYHDTYHAVSDREFHEAVASTFGLADAETAARLVAERGVTREEFVCYLAVRSHLDGADDRSADDLAAMAGMVDRVVPDSPVPPVLPDVTDAPSDFLAGRDRAVVAVWKRFCDPCEALRPDLPDLLDGGDPPRTTPGGAPVAGVDGEAATEFCEAYGVESAPAFVLFEGGSVRRTVSGADADAVAAALREAYS